MPRLNRTRSEEDEHQRALRGPRRLSDRRGQQRGRERSAESPPCVEPRDAGTAGALNNVSQQLGSAIGVALISTFVATATSHYLVGHGSTAVVGATVHGFTVGYWWAAGVFWAGAVICSALIRGGTRLHHEAGQPEPLDEIAGGLI
jgi:hypothetical protein